MPVSIMRVMQGQERAEAGVGPGVLDHIELVGQQPTVAGPADLDVLDLGPAVAEGHHALAAGLDPADRAPSRVGQPRAEQLLGVVPILAPKPPPTSGVMTRTWPAPRPKTARRSRTDAGPGCWPSG